MTRCTFFGIISLRLSTVFAFGIVVFLSIVQTCNSVHSGWLGKFVSAKLAEENVWIAVRVSIARKGVNKSYNKTTKMKRKHKWNTHFVCK